jgi:hypothetical protein
MATLRIYGFIGHDKKFCFNVYTFIRIYANIFAEQYFITI